MLSGKMSPGYNTLPEWEGVASGFEGSVGDQEPLGFWDPAGFTKDGDVEKFKRRREVEIKHGRVSMLATIGYIVPEYFKFPGYLSPSEGLKFEDVPNGLAALSKVPPTGLAQFAAFIAFLELGAGKPMLVALMPPMPLFPPFVAAPHVPPAPVARMVRG